MTKASGILAFIIVAIRLVSAVVDTSVLHKRLDDSSASSAYVYLVKTDEDGNQIDRTACGPVDTDSLETVESGFDNCDVIDDEGDDVLIYCIVDSEGDDPKGAYFDADFEDLCLYVGGNIIT